MGLRPSGTHSTATPTPTLSGSHIYSLLLPWPFTEGSGLLNYRFNAQSLLTVCQTERRHKARLQMKSKSLCRLSSTTSTGPRCRTFTYTECLQRANTEHLSTTTTVSIFKQYPPQSIQRHTFPHPPKHLETCAPPWLKHKHPSNRHYLAASVNPLLVSTNLNRPLMSTNADWVSLNTSP